MRVNEIMRVNNRGSDGGAIASGRGGVIERIKALGSRERKRQRSEDGGGREDREWER